MGAAAARAGDRRGDGCRSRPCAEGISELLELRVDERRGTLFFGRGDDGLVIVAPASDRGAIDEVAERFEVRIGVSDPASYDDFAAARRSGAGRPRPRRRAA